VNPSSHGAAADAGSMSVVLMLQLPTGETVPCTMPAVVVVPSLSSTAVSCSLSQSTASVPSKPVQLMLDGGLVGHASSQVTTQSSPSVNSDAPLSLPGVIPSVVVTGCDSQPGAAFDMQESGLTALGIAASTREVGSIN